MIWETLLSAALEAGLGVLAEAGFGDEARALKERLTKRTEKARREAFDRAFQQAVERAGEEHLRPLLKHRPFQEAVITGLLDPDRLRPAGSSSGVEDETIPRPHSCIAPLPFCFREHPASGSLDTRTAILRSWYDEGVVQGDAYKRPSHRGRGVAGGSALAVLPVCRFVTIGV